MHMVTTAQETILRSTVAGLDERGRFVLAAASVADVPLSRDEMTQVASALIADARAVVAGIRLAMDRGVSLERPAARSRCTMRSECLAPTYSMPALRTLAALGETDVLLDAITTEFFHDFGLSTELEHLIIDALRAPGVTASDRFWALDTLAFWRLQDGDIVGAEAFVADMAKDLED
jgi:hypothetical protein